MSLGSSPDLNGNVLMKKVCGRYFSKINYCKNLFAAKVMILRKLVSLRFFLYSNKRFLLKNPNCSHIVKLF